MTDRRKRLRRWLFKEFGNGNVAPCQECGRLLNNATMTIDRYPLPGKFGGTYVKGNCRPLCVRCNCCHIGEPSDWGEQVPLTHRPFERLTA